MKRNMELSFSPEKNYKQGRLENQNDSDSSEGDQLSLLPLELLESILSFAVSGSFDDALLYRLVCKTFKSVVDEFLMQNITIHRNYIKCGGIAFPVQGVPELRQLFPQLTIYGLPLGSRFKHQSVHDISRLSVFNAIHFYHSDTLKDISSLFGMQHVKLTNCDILKDISPLRKTESVELSCLPELRDVSPLAEACQVSLISCPLITSIASLKNIHTIELNLIPALTDVSSLANAQFVSLEYCENIRDVSPLKSVPKVRLNGLKNLTNVSCLTEVKHLQLANLMKVTSLNGLEGLSKFEATSCAIQHLPAFRNATFVHIVDCHYLTTLLEGPCVIKTLFMSNCSKLQSILPLGTTDFSSVNISTLFFNEELRLYLLEVLSGTKFIPRIIVKNSLIDGVRGQAFGQICEIHHVHTTTDLLCMTDDGEITCRGQKSEFWKGLPSSLCEKCKQGRNVIVIEFGF